MQNGSEKWKPRLYRKRPNGFTDIEEKVVDNSSEGNVGYAGVSIEKDGAALNRQPEKIIYKDDFEAHIDDTHFEVCL